MAERNAPSTNGKPAEKLDEIRNIIVGPHLSELELKIEQLSRQVRQLTEQNTAQRQSYEKKMQQMQADFLDRLEKYVRHAAGHKARTTVKVKALAEELRRVVGLLETDRRRRSAFAETMAALADQMRAAPAGLENKATTAAHRDRRKKPATGAKISIKKRQEVFGKRSGRQSRRASANKSL